MAGNREDASLIVELGKYGTMLGVPEAARTIWADDFDPEAAVANDSAIRPLLFWYETIGTLVKNGLLDRELVYDWLWVAATWERVGPAALRAREKAGNPHLAENFEALAAGQRDLQPA
jgi:hypothetical protein